MKCTIKKKSNTFLLNNAYVSIFIAYVFRKSREKTLKTIQVRYSEKIKAVRQSLF